ncbi:MAG TPA: PIN domain-containing protein [Candidatus Binataceae bacterium]|nr:PIN domain-containing protein [Candidatus Binataceae bacterium]
MRIFFDTSVLVAASERSHPHHARAKPALYRVIAGEDQGFINLHSVAELYAALTRLPVKPRIHPTEAAHVITANVLAHFELVPLGRDDYVETLNATASSGWAGPKIYDALLLRCAAACAAERIYTFNLADFRQLAPDILQARICAP